MTDKQPEALRLADWHKAMAEEPNRNEAKRDKHRSTETELRRLHEVNAELVEACKVAKQFIGNMPVKTKPYLDKIILVEDMSLSGRIWSQLTAAIAKATGEQQ